MRPELRLATGFLIALLIAACGGSQVRDSAPTGSNELPELPGDAVPRPEARSRYGNGPVYEVLGKRYTVMPSSLGYKERGVASWYGKKFHGRLTSNREPYDMYAMTAAHKTLPLPTFVRVRNLRNNRSIVVRVNDRGPFVHNRVIDLSYAAAARLDMIGDGTSLVEVTAISFDEPEGDRPVRQSTPEPVVTKSYPEPRADNLVYVQVGAFGERSNAERRRVLLMSGGIGGAFIDEDAAANPPLFRVRIGPVTGVEHYDRIVSELAALGIADPYLITP